MPPRVFQHPLARHPTVGPLLSLLEARGTAEVRACPALWLELRIARHLSLQRFLRWSEHAVLPPELAVDPLARLEATEATLPARYHAVPEDLLRDFSPSRGDALGTDAALDLAIALRAQGPAGLAPRDVRLRALVRTGVWLGARPRFIGRLDDEVGPEAYRPSVPLVAALIERAAWADAARVADRLAPEARRVAHRQLWTARLRGGLPAPTGRLTPRMKDDLQLCRAELAVEARDFAAAVQTLEAIAHPRRRALAAAQLTRRVVGQPNDADFAETLLRSADPLTTGAGAWARGAVRAARGNWRGAAEDLVRAGRAPRHDPAHWLEGRRPDAALAIALTEVALRDSRPFVWPWSVRGRTRWLDDLGVMRRVVHRVGLGVASDPAAVRRLRPSRSQLRLQQAAEIVRVERIDWAGKDRRPAHAPEAQAFVRGLLGDEAFGAALPRDPSDPVRAYFDDGVARSVAGRPRRRILVNACKQALAQSRAAPRARQVDAAAEVRLATLATLGGGRAERVLTNHLGADGAHHPLHDSGVRALYEVSPAALLAPSMLEPMRFGNGASQASLREHLEAAGVLPGGFSAAARQLLERLEVVRPDDAAEWWSELCRDAWTNRAAPPSPRLLAALAALPDARLRRPATAVVRALARAAAALAALPPEPWLERVREKQGSLQMALALGAPPAGGAPWPLARWQQMLRQTKTRRFGAPDAGLVPRWTGRLGLRTPEAVAERLLTGRAPHPGLDAPLALPKAGLRLRYLHKVKDAFAFLRFADCVPCCFNSTSAWYESVDAARHISQLWRDPMSFCLAVETAAAPHAPRGFVFGGFGLLEDGSSAMLLNGLYLTRSEPELRCRLSWALATEVARPTGAAWLGLANRHGGHGELSGGFRADTRSVRRLRALRRANGRLEVHVYDDISRSTNRFVRSHLYWHRLDVRRESGRYEA